MAQGLAALPTCVCGNPTVHGQAAPDSLLTSSERGKAEELGWDTRDLCLHGPHNSLLARTREAGMGRK